MRAGPLPGTLLQRHGCEFTAVLFTASVSTLTFPARDACSLLWYALALVSSAGDELGRAEGRLDPRIHSGRLGEDLQGWAPGNPLGPR